MKRPELAIICALTKDRQVIGTQQKLPWNLPKDLEYFKTKTMGKTVVMGRKTFESIGRPLPKRKNIVLSTQAKSSALPAELHWVSSLEEALKCCSNDEQCFVIGGHDVFLKALPLAQTLYLTWVDQSFEGDVTFPKVSWEDFDLVSEHADTDNGVPIRFCEYRRS